MSRTHFTPALTPDFLLEEPVKRRWRTPPWFIRLLVDEYGAFGLDAAAGEENSVAPRYITRKMNTLATEWGPLAEGKPVWFNPPYGGEAKACPPGCRKNERKPTHVHHLYDFPGTGAFVTRAIQQTQNYNLLTFMFLESATDTAWWRAAFRASMEVRILPRIACYTEAGLPGSNPAGGTTLFILAGSWKGAGPRVSCWDVKERK